MNLNNAILKVLKIKIKLSNEPGSDNKDYINLGNVYIQNGSISKNGIELLEKAEDFFDTIIK